jgi:hypothetical protein
MADKTTETSGNVCPGVDTTPKEGTIYHIERSTTPWIWPGAKMTPQQWADALDAHYRRLQEDRHRTD